MNLDRLAWQLRRRSLARRIPGFSAHWTSYAGANVTFSEFNSLRPRSWLWNASLGRFTYVVGAKVKNANVGAFCSIGPEAIVGGMGRHPTHWLTTHPAFYSRLDPTEASFAKLDFDELPTTEVGNDVWIGCHAVILDGVKIGDGAIIATGAVVAKDVPPYAIVGGVPAKPIRYRFSDDVVEALLGLKWWNASTQMLREHASLFTARDEWKLEDVEAIGTALR